MRYKVINSKPTYFTTTMAFSAIAQAVGNIENTRAIKDPKGQTLLTENDLIEIHMMMLGGYRLGFLNSKELLQPTSPDYDIEWEMHDDDVARFFPHGRIERFNIDWETDFCDCDACVSEPAPSWCGWYDPGSACAGYFYVHIRPDTDGHYIARVVHVAYGSRGAE